MVDSVSIDFLSNSTRDARFIAYLLTILVLIGTVFLIIWEIFCGRVFLNSFLLLLLVHFVSGFRLESMYMPHHNCHSKTHSSPWFSTAFAAAIVYRSYSSLFRLHWQNNSSQSKVKFRQASNCWSCQTSICSSPSLPRNLARGTFGELLIWFSKKGNSVILPLFSDLEVLSSASDKSKLFVKNHSKNLYRTLICQRHLVRIVLQC